METAPLAPARFRLAVCFVLACLAFLAGSCGDGKPSANAPVLPASYTSDGRIDATKRAPGPFPNLVVVLVDTLRRDAVAYPGEAGGVMPKLAARAAKSVAFSHAASVSPWTVPSVATLLTGLYPHEHGCDDPDTAPRLLPSVTTYAEALQNGYGYETAVFTSVPWFRQSDHSMLQGFGDGSVGQGFGLQGTKPMLERWLKRRDAKKPFFLLLHTFEAHDPYGEKNHPFPDSMAGWRKAGIDKASRAFDVSSAKSPAEMTRLFFLDRVGRGALSKALGSGFRNPVVEFTWKGLRENPHTELLDDLRTGYLDGVRWVDGVMDKAIGALHDFGLMDNTLLVITSDHGEQFGEHGIIGHGRQVFDELIRIPLLMQGPAPFDEPRVVEESVGLIDVMPTFFDWARLEQLPGSHGRSLLPLLTGDRTKGHPVISEERVVPHNTEPGTKRLLASVRDSEWKYIVEYDAKEGTVSELVFDLEGDPGETQDLVKADPDGTVPWSDEFCAAVEQVRDTLWDQIEDRRALKGSLYGGGDRVPPYSQPEGCQPDRR